MIECPGIAGGVVMARGPADRRHQLLIAARSPRVGRIELRVRRAFIANNGHPLSTTELMRRVYPRVVKFKHWHSYSIRRAAPKFAVRVGRRRCRGMPIVWQLVKDQRFNR